MAPPLFNDALMKALSPIQKRMKVHSPELETDDEPKFKRNYQGPPTLQPQAQTND
jgi:hypothetical protein